MSYNGVFDEVIDVNNNSTVDVDHVVTDDIYSKTDWSIREWISNQLIFYGVPVRSPINQLICLDTFDWMTDSRFDL